jgi:signal transduction histidine kinase
MRVKYKLMISYLVLIIASVSTLGFLVEKQSNNEILNQINEKSQLLTESISTTLSVRKDLLIEKSYSDSNFAKTLLNNFNNLSVDYNEIAKVGDFKLPILYSGTQRLSLDDTIVDKIEKSTGTTVTIFLLHDDKLIRVSSTIFKNNDKLIGTYISSDSDSYKKMINKEEYIGDVIIDGDGYITRMKPLLDKDKKVIGAIGIGNKILNNYLEQTLNNIKLGETGYVYILDSQGNKIINPNEEEKTIKKYDFFKEMCLNKTGIIKHTYGGVEKISYYKYFEPWNWYIVTTVDYDEIKSSSKLILEMTIVTGLIIIVFGGIIALFLTNNIVRPINKLKSCMEIAGKGDLAVRCDLNNKDEIGILSNSFNNMLAENQRLVEEVVNYDKLKTEFIANMSHELRTPLNIIFSTAQLFDVFITKGEDLNTDKIKNYTSSIKQNCYRLLRLVNNLIDMTKIESGFMDINLKNADIVQVAEEITQSTAQHVQYMSRTIIFDTDVEEKVMAFDAEKLERILLNLISNATKFTNPGDEINVTLYDKDNQIIISVKDTGIGIPKEKLAQIFQRFKQIDPMLNRNQGGSGIGLSIVKALVEMHGGTINVKSKFNEGTEFIICLPAKVIEEEEDIKVKGNSIKQSHEDSIKIELADIYR